MDVMIGPLQIPKSVGDKPRHYYCLSARHRSLPGTKRGTPQMAFLPRLLFALILVLPGGFVVGPVVLLLKRWRDRRATEQLQQSLIVVQPVLAPQLPRESHPIEPTRVAA
jgi:hypothetical protein